MITKKINVFCEKDFSKLAQAGEMLKDGKLVAFPTETVYGLGGNALDPDASKKIYQAKGRPSDNPLIVHISVPDEAEKYCVPSPLYYKLAERYMPGPLTVILPKKQINGVPVIPAETSGGLDSVAVRCPADPIANALIREAGVPIAAPSANRSGSPSPTTAKHVLDDLDGRIDAVIDGGEAVFGLESTVVRLEGDKIYLLRPGAVTAEQLSEFTSELIIAAEEVKADEKPLSPGMKYKHYAPKKPLILLDGDYANIIAFIKENQHSQNCAVICYEEDTSELTNKNLIVLGKRADLNTQAHRLFDCLRKSDETDADVIYAHLPKKDGIGLALYNRLIRAAGHKIIKL